MLLKKQGMPPEDSLVLCTITNIQYHSVFARLEEYDNKSGMIHISEVAPGRIRNIRDYVKEGKVVICKVLRLDLQKGHIDLSLRRVNEQQKRTKLDEIKQEQLAEAIVKQVAKKHNQDERVIYADLAQKLISEELPGMYQVFEEVAFSDKDLTKSGVDPVIAKELTELIKQRIKLPEVQLKGEFGIHTYAPNGIEIIREALKAGEETHDVEIHSLGGGRYTFIATGMDYEEAEQTTEDIKNAVLKYLTSHKVTAEFKTVE